MIRRLGAPIVAIALLAGCGHIAWSSLPRASAAHAYAKSYRACRTAVQELGLRGFADRVGATSRRPALVAHAAVRYAIPYVRDRRPGYLAFRRAGYLGCVAGIRRALQR
jgi:hypothetical protein